MRKRLTVVVAAGLLAFPVIDTGGIALAATRATPVKRVATKKYAGTEAQADRWGTVTVNVTLKTTTTTTGAKKKVVKHYTDLGGNYTYHTDRSQFIMSQALPVLRQEFLQAQSANIQMVSGATYTSEAFVQSLQSALSKASAAKSA
jgi:uncharacterized protein with FMN-binding domain